ncbi:hypothetical protein FTO70_03640 [Methanosarcina sp. KYL-1]|nr:hypothetical protein [Methanosarcina sp. KYL-1]
MRSSFFWAFVLYPAILLWYIELRFIFIGKPDGVQNIPDFYLTLLWLVFGVFFPFMLYCTKHITEVRKDGIYIRFIPLNLSFKKIPYYVVEECRLRTYDPLTGKEAEIKEEIPEPGMQKVNPVVILKLISGKKMLISSRKPEELCRAIRQASAQC